MLTDQKTSIKHWAVDDRPREKLRNNGPETLSHSELIAILLQNGTRQKSAIDLAREILQLGRNNLAEVGKLSIKELMKVKGIGEAKAITVTAALELGRRRQAAESLEKPVVTDSASVARYLQAILKDKQQELFIVLFLNRANRINHSEIISKGGITGTVVDPRIILKRALEEDAVSIVLCHNHPSGSLKPSRADETLTAKIKEAAKYFDIKVYDHIIVSDQGFYSFADDGLL
ncbi:MAG: DNA repair protein RadC [Agriterribacter sp.]